MPIPVNTPLLGEEEKQNLLACIETGWISSEGPFVKEFESSLASYLNRDQGIAVTSGSAALDITIRSLELEPGDEIIVPTFTIISPIQSIISSGAKPVLIDSEPDSWNMDVTQVESKITPRTKAILAVHIYGLPVDMSPLQELCQRYHLRLIEDAAEMLGQTYKGAHCGSFGDISVFSFYPNKHITTGEGGMILTNDQQLADRCRKLRNLAFEPNGRRFVHEELGWNYRMTNMQAALGVAQLKKLSQHIERKRDIGAKYRTALKDLQAFQLPLHETKDAVNIYWVFGLVAATEELAEQAMQFLRNEAIGTRPFFWCAHEQPVFRKMGLFEGERYPVAEKLARTGFYIPSGLGLSDSEIDEVVRQLRTLDERLMSNLVLQ